MNKNFEIKERIVRAGNSKVFQSWQENAGISMDEFIEGLRWLCNDPKNGGKCGKRLTRELGCIRRADAGYSAEQIDTIGFTPSYRDPSIVGLYRLKRVYTTVGLGTELCTFYDEETGKPWGMGNRSTASISADDRI